MISPKTSFVSLKHRDSNSYRVGGKKEKFKYFLSQEFKYRLKNNVRIFLENIGYPLWKERLLRSAIDFVFNSLVISLTAIMWLSGNWWLKGFAITMFFILLKSYTKDFKSLLGG